MEFGILGILEVSDGDRALDVRPAKLRALLAILLLHANEVVSSHRLVEALWGEVPPASAANTLQGYISHLRRVLQPDGPGAGRPLLHTRSPGYVFAVETESVDAWRFERLAAEGRRLLAASDAAQATSTLTNALSLWRGAALAEFIYEDFAQDEIARLEELRLRVVEDRIDAELALGRHLDVLGELKALTATVPLRERPWGQWMLGLYRSGRQADALRAYRDLRHTLADELGIDPSPELQRLEGAILAQDPALDWRARSRDAEAGVGTTLRLPPCESVIPLPHLLSRPQNLPLVGRDTELGHLIAAWDEAAGGSRRAVLLAGEPGIGKTRLTAELARQAHAESGVVLAGRCDEGMGVPYQPFVEALRHFVDSTCECHLTEHLGRWPGELIRLVPEIASRASGLTPPLTADPETERYRLFDAVADWLATASTRRPVLVVIDDLHWASEPTLLLLRHVLRAPRSMRLSLVATYRDSELDRSHPLNAFVADVAREPGGTRLHLVGLDEAGVEELISATGGERLTAASRPWTKVIHEDTKGNPFLIAEVVRHVLESGALERGQAPSSLLDLGIPEGVRTVVSRRVSRLSDPTMAVLSTASVAGLEFELPVVEAASLLAEDVVVSAMEEAISRRLVEEAPGSGTNYRFSHGLVRAALYAEMTGARRTLLHRRVGDAIESVHAAHLDQRLAELAHHFGEAAGGRPDARAAEYAERAGDRALAQLAHEESVGHYRRALSLLESPSPGVRDEERHCSILISLGEAQRRAGDPRYRETLLEGARRAQRLHDPDLLVKAALANHRGQFSIAGEVDHELVEILRTALAAYPSEDSGVRARLLGQLAAELVASGDWDTRVELSDRALAMARRVGDPETLVFVLNLRFVALWAASTLRERLTIAAEARELATGLENPTLGFYSGYFSCLAAMEAGDMQTADRHLIYVHERAETLNQPTLRWYERVGHAKRALIAGALDDSERIAFEALGFGQTTGQPDALRRFGAMMFTIRLHQGRLEELLATAESGFVPSSSTGSLPMLSRVGLAMVYCQMDRRSDAQRVFDALLAEDLADVPNDYGWLPTIALTASVCAYLKVQCRARLLYGLLDPYREQFVDLGPTWFGSTAHHLALMASALGDFQQAEADFSYAAAEHARVGSSVWLAHTELEWGDMLMRGHRGSDRRRGKDHIESAYRTALELGLGGIARRAGLLVEPSRVP